jgi:hypothetical protein
MRTWNTDARPGADSRLAAWFVWLERHRAPDWILRLAYRLAR